MRVIDVMHGTDKRLEVQGYSRHNATHSILAKIDKMRKKSRVEKTLNTIYMTGIAVKTELTEKNTLEDFLEEINLPTPSKRKLERIFKTEDTLEIILSETGDTIHKKTNNKDYLDLCMAFMEAGFHPEQFPFFSKFTNIILDLLYDHTGMSGEFSQKIDLAKNIEEHLPSKPIYDLLKNLYILRQLYYTDTFTTTVNKNFFVATAKMYIKEYYEK